MHTEHCTGDIRVMLAEYNVPLHYPSLVAAYWMQIGKGGGNWIGDGQYIKEKKKKGRKGEE